MLRFFATFETAKSSVKSSASSWRLSAIIEISSWVRFGKSPDFFAASFTVIVNVAVSEVPGVTPESESVDSVWLLNIAFASRGGVSGISNCV